MQLPSFHVVGGVLIELSLMVAQWYDLRLRRDAEDPGSNPALCKQWSRDHRDPIDHDVPATPTLPDHMMLTFATNKLSTRANGQREDAASFFFCPPVQR